MESPDSGGFHAQASKGPSMRVILQLAFQSLGIVYGDIGTSPLYLYVYSVIFTDGIKDKDDILGILSLIFYTITLIPVVKYVFFVLQANDNGGGGTFALYSLICRYAKVGLIPNHQPEDKQMSNYQLEYPNNRAKRASKVKSKLENNNFMKHFLLFATILGTSMVIGDGVLTPCISVLSAMGGIKNVASGITDDKVALISAAILFCLFMVQRFGVEKVGYTFAPIICIWFTLLICIGIFNFIKRYKKIWRNFLNISLGGVVQCITGAEALFADVGHFTVRSIQISMCCATYPALILAYAGQASFLRKNLDLASDTFYKSIPNAIYWPMFVVAVLAAIIASQAMIAATFSIIQQSLASGCFPRVRIVHTSAKHEGQVYVPEVNYILMIACIAVTIGFKTTAKISNAYGIAVVFVMTLTSSLLVLIMVLIWKTHILFVIGYVLTIGVIELVYLSSVLYKFNQGGYLSLAFAAVLMMIMYVWNDVYRRKYYYELHHKVSPTKFNEIIVDANLCRTSGLAMFYSELVQDIPPIFEHYVANVPLLHSVLVFVSIKSLPISKVMVEERFLFRRVQPKEFNIFRCVVRYGYTDVRNEREPLEKLLVERLKEFIIGECWMLSQDHEELSNVKEGVRGEISDEERLQHVIGKEIDAIEKAAQAGVDHLIGDNEVIACKGSNIGKRILIDYAYNILKKNLRQSDKIFDIPNKRMVKVVMTYEL